MTLRSKNYSYTVLIALLQHSYTTGICTDVSRRRSHSTLHTSHFSRITLDLGARSFTIGHYLLSNRVSYSTPHENTTKLRTTNLFSRVVNGFTITLQSSHFTHYSLRIALRTLLFACKRPSVKWGVPSVKCEAGCSVVAKWDVLSVMREVE